MTQTRMALHNEKLKREIVAELDKVVDKATDHNINLNMPCLERIDEHIRGIADEIAGNQ